MKGLSIGAMIFVLVLAQVGSLFAAEEAKAASDVEAPLIQIAILLDTSGSMSGLINQAKTQLWKIVNEFATAKKDGRRPVLQVALYEYGNNGIPKNRGYIRMILPLTDNLDKVSEELFALRTNGGSEYCGRVIKEAAEKLTWSESGGDLKAIFIAGNEPFTQGDVDYRKACKAAIEKGIVVNTIHCGRYKTGVDTGWKDGALLADGKYMNIDQDRKAVHIDAPQDKEIARLGAELNQTYVPYGAAGGEGAQRQKAEDRKARSAAFGSFLERQVTKAGAQYRSASWDLVDALREGKVKLEELKAEGLPEAMRKMTVAERKAHLEAKAKRRAEVQQQIRKLNEARKKYVAEQMKKLKASGVDTFDRAMIRALRQQAAKKNFKFE